MSPKNAPKIESALESAARELAASAGLRGEIHLNPLDGSANNRVFLLESGDKRAVLKHYFHHPEDPRDRLNAEYAFSRFAWDQGLRSLPQPLASNPERHLGLYGFIEGRRLEPSDVGVNCVKQALKFYLELNQHYHLSQARSLPKASEACFTLAEHLTMVHRRVARLEHLRPSDETDSEMRDFVRKDLAEVLRDVEDKMRQEAKAYGISLNKPLAVEERRLSPSDFGFHNAIEASGGKLFFIDFEYAGWDDPARMVCDFFCQPAVPAPANCLESFAKSVVQNLPDPERQLRRIELLMPIYHIKWCCILLNDFLSVGMERRRFASRQPPSAGQKAMQLGKARRLLRGERVTL